MPATDALTGRAAYFSKFDIVRDDYRTIMATCALPAFCRPVNVNGHFYYDGGVADSIPVHHALEHGCDKVVIILSNPRDFVKQPEAHRPIYKRMLRKYPKLLKESTTAISIIRPRLIFPTSWKRGACADFRAKPPSAARHFLQKCSLGTAALRPGRIRL